MYSANERMRYIVTPPLIGWAHTQDDPCIVCGFLPKWDPKHGYVIATHCTAGCIGLSTAQTQSCPVITRSNTTRYCIYIAMKNAELGVDFWMPIIQPIAHHQLWGVYEGILDKSDRIVTGLHWAVRDLFVFIFLNISSDLLALFLVRDACASKLPSTRFQAPTVTGTEINKDIWKGRYSDVIMYDGVSNHQANDCLLRRRSKKTSKLHVTGLCVGN